VKASEGRPWPEKDGHCTLPMKQQKNPRYLSIKSMTYFLIFPSPVSTIMMVKKAPFWGFF